MYMLIFGLLLRMIALNLPIFVGMTAAVILYTCDRQYVWPTLAGMLVANEFYVRAVLFIVKLQVPCELTRLLYFVVAVGSGLVLGLLGRVAIITWRTP